MCIRDSLFLVTGMLGGFTTFSTFSFDTMGLLGGGKYLTACLYAGGSVFLGLAACGAGSALARFGE